MVYYISYSQLSIVEKFIYINIIKNIIRLIKFKNQDYIQCYQGGIRKLGNCLQDKIEKNLPMI